jgi:sortase A
VTAVRRRIGVLLCAAITALGLSLAAQGAWIPVKAALAQVLLDRAFAAGLGSGKPVKPWPWADSVPLARIAVPRLGLSETILSGGSGQALAFGPTPLLPGGAEGLGGVTLLAAHRDTHFRFMRDLKRGDRLELQGIDGRRHSYVITHFDTLHRDRFAYPQTPPRRMLALITCYPFDGPAHSPLRRVAWAEEVPPLSI